MQLPKFIQRMNALKLGIISICIFATGFVLFGMIFPMLFTKMVKSVWRQFRFQIYLPYKSDRINLLQNLSHFKPATQSHPQIRFATNVRENSILPRFPHLYVQFNESG